MTGIIPMYKTPDRTYNIANSLPIASMIIYDYVIVVVSELEGVGLTQIMCQSCIEHSNSDNNQFEMLFKMSENILSFFFFSYF